VDKRTFKVLAPISKHDGGHWWMRCGTGYMNRDNSINIYLDAMTKEMRFTLRELDDEDLRRRETYRSGGDGGAARAMDGGMTPPGRLPTMPVMAPDDDEAALSQ
jgi:hypothetical protein